MLKWSVTDSMFVGDIPHIATDAEVDVSPAPSSPACPIVHLPVAPTRPPIFNDAPVSSPKEPAPRPTLTLQIPSPCPTVHSAKHPKQRHGHNLRSKYFPQILTSPMASKRIRHTAAKKKRVDDKKPMCGYDSDYDEDVSAGELESDAEEDEVASLKPFVFINDPRQNPLQAGQKTLFNSQESRQSPGAGPSGGKLPVLQGNLYFSQERNVLLTLMLL
ncbi:hypothetical protein DL93DRAFT_1860847 [Clavulina sp. PMI_390]|nr:hypothetical protein DL93DRAFT_1860847 [Clavulina sp. PMI_390]